MKRRLLSLSLRVRDLENILNFYHKTLGLHLEADPPLYHLYPEGRAFTLTLLHDPRASLRPHPSVGLYHFALLVPNRTALGGLFLRLHQAGAYFEGAADHGVSEALYFRDPEGNGLELYRDRPPAEWPREGPLMFTLPLDLKALVQEGKTPKTLPPETQLGHIHLHVEDLAQAEAFYGQTLGMAVTLRGYPGALFFAWDGYHHHVGANIWAGRAKASEGATGLLSYTFRAPKEVAAGRLLDPTGAEVVLLPEV